jgi:hypothetical protein
MSIEQSGKTSMVMSPSTMIFAISKRIADRTLGLIEGSGSPITECPDRIDLGEGFLSVPEQRTAKSVEIPDRFEGLDGSSGGSGTSDGCGNSAGARWQPSRPMPAPAVSCHCSVTRIR